MVVIGESARCPSDVFHTSNHTCRPAARFICRNNLLIMAIIFCLFFSACDAVELCSGTSPSCGVDKALPAGQLCRPAVGEVILESFCFVAMKIMFFYSTNRSVTLPKCVMVVSLRVHLIKATTVHRVTIKTNALKAIEFVFVSKFLSFSKNFCI